MAEEKIQLQNVHNLSSLETIDFSDGYACDLATGICGPIDEQSQNEKVEEEHQHANNNLV